MLIGKTNTSENAPIFDACGYPMAEKRKTFKMRNEKGPSIDQKHIIIASESSDTLKSLGDLFEQNGYEVSIVPDGSEALRHIMSENPKVYVLTPPHAADMQWTLRKPTTTDMRQVTQTPSTSRSMLDGDYSEIIGESPQILKVLTQIDHIVNTNATVLIYGETGTGKELIARALHKNSKRSEKAMVVANCAGFPENLIESELFGHEQGAFTDAKSQHIGKFEQAQDSTLFLDEIGELPLTLQPKFLRALQEREIERIGSTKSIPINFRVVAATNQNLKESVENGTFRDDLYHRLKVVYIHLPPLRERKKDIHSLAKHFLEKYSQEPKCPKHKIAPQTLVLLHNYAWPGNVRELENVMIYATIFAKREEILPEHLPEEIQELKIDLLKEEQTPKEEQTLSFPIGTTIKQMEKTVILNTLDRMEGNRIKTAEILQISVNTLRNKLKTYAKK
ncbi:DNA-binding response regulator [Candidatus Poribacteria bacterium]|nr:MAG: DNA-binding response regulator [Candidatus Poribacteria bacterium]